MAAYQALAAALDPDMYCIILFKPSGNVISSLPGNMHPLFYGPRLPIITIHHKLLAQQQ